MTLRSYPRFRRYATREQAALSQAADRAANAAALAETHPATVTLDHFIRRDLGAAIAAGRITVTGNNRVFGASGPRILVRDVRYIPGNYRRYFIVTDSREWETHYGGESLAVYWHDLAATWNRLTLPMRRALCILANPDSPLRTRGGAGGGVHHLTLRALATRGLIVDSTLTPFAAAMYRQHKQELEHDVQ